MTGSLPWSSLLAAISATKIAVRPRSASVSMCTCKMRFPYELQKGQTHLFHKLPSGLRMEVIFQNGLGSTFEERQDEGQSIPLVFIHGSFHAAWCWAEHWMPFFSHRGFDCYALSLQGQGESDAPAGPVSGTLQTHASDVADFIEKNLTSPPVLLGHSFGGLIVQYYITISEYEHVHEDFYPKLAGAVLLCSVPPSGNSGLVWRYLFRNPVAAFKVTRSLAAKGFQTSLSLCRETFFSTSMEDHLVLRYQQLLSKSCRVPLFDLRTLNGSLPLPRPLKLRIKVLVLGAENDFIVDGEGVKETGDFLSVVPLTVEGVAHDMMLDCLWENGANVILSWLRALKEKE